MSDAKQVILDDVPFQIGQQVEVIVLVSEEPLRVLVHELKALFKATQALPQLQALSDEDITAEVAAYRNGE